MSHHSLSTGAATVSLSKCFVAWLKAIRTQTDLHCWFSAISRFVKASALIAVAAAIRDSEWDRVDTVASIGHRDTRKSRNRTSTVILIRVKKIQLTLLFIFSFFTFFHH